MGYVVTGTLRIRTADGEEVFEAGDAYVIQPGHVPGIAAGSEFVTFTPAEEAKAMAGVVQANMMSYARKHGIELS